MKHHSPLRYPGGKGMLSGFLADVIEQNGLEGCRYYEPYAGGAGAALRLLDEGLVSNVYLNDIDIRIYAFWESILNDTDAFIKKINTVPLTITEWRRQYAICKQPKEHNALDVGFAAFYMNRCNRSGVLTGSGPIGGYEQKGKWKMDVRFNRVGLVERILNVARNKEYIHVTNDDAIEFLKKNLSRVRGKKQVLTYLDPPYVSNGQRLYMNAYEINDHERLAKYMLDQKALPWIMSYDDADIICDLYKECQVAKLPIRYTLQVKRAAHELIIGPKYLLIPDMCRMGHGETTLQEIA